MCKRFTPVMIKNTTRKYYKKMTAGQQGGCLSVEYNSAYVISFTKVSYFRLRGRLLILRLRRIWTAYFSGKCGSSSNSVATLVVMLVKHSVWELSSSKLRISFLTFLQGWSADSWVVQYTLCTKPTHSNKSGKWVNKDTYGQWRIVSY